jgi:hypothetical protein
MPETGISEKIIDVSRRARNASLAVAICYFALSTEAGYPLTLVEGTLGALALASMAQAVNVYLTEETE